MKLQPSQRLVSSSNTLGWVTLRKHETEEALIDGGVSPLPAAWEATRWTVRQPQATSSVPIT